MLQFLQWTILRMLLVKGVFSLYLSIHGLQKGPGKFLTGSLKVLEKSLIFSSERVGTLDREVAGSSSRYLARALMLKAPYCGSGIGSNEQGEYCRVVLR